jgi:Fic family protein
VCNLAMASDLIEGIESTKGSPYLENHCDIMREAIIKGEQRQLISPLILREWHSKIFPYGGQWRDCRVIITGSDTQEGFKPPEPVFVPSLVCDFIEQLDQWMEYDDPFLALAESHLRFERIHPFSDGNGRIGRVILNWLAAFFGLPPIKINPQQRNEYLDFLSECDTIGLSQFLQRNIVQ